MPPADIFAAVAAAAAIAEAAAAAATAAAGCGTAALAAGAGSGVWRVVSGDGAPPNRPAMRLSIMALVLASMAAPSARMLAAMWASSGQTAPELLAIPALSLRLCAVLSAAHMVRKAS